MTESILIVVVLILGGLSYWLFADADRWERISSMIGPWTPLFWVISSLYWTVKSIYDGKLLWIILDTLLMAFWVRTYLRERAQRRSVSQSQNVLKQMPT